MDFVDDQRPQWSPEEALEFEIACATADLVQALNISTPAGTHKHLLLVVLPDPPSHPRDHTTTTQMTSYAMDTISLQTEVHYLGYMDEHVIHPTTDVQP